MGIFDRFPYSSTHEMNLDFMLGKATEIAESLQEIDTHKEQAEQAATNAAQSATNAAQAAQAAAGSQTAASASAAAADQHKTDAEDAADRAEAASDLADEAVEQAQTAAQNASTSATAAGTAAQNASTAADGAIASAAAAETRINNLAASLPEDFTALNEQVQKNTSKINYSVYQDIEHNSDFSMGFITNNQSIGAVVDTDSITENYSYIHWVIPVKSGDNFTITSAGGSGARSWALLDTDKKMLANAAANARLTNYNLQVTADGYLIVNAERANVIGYNVQGHQLIQAAIKEAQNAVTNSTLQTLFRGAFVVHKTHNANGVFNDATNRNAIVHPIMFPFDATIYCDNSHLLTYQTYANQLNTSFIATYSTWMPFVIIPSGTWFTIVIRNNDDSATDESTTNGIFIICGLEWLKDELSNARNGIYNNYETVGRHIRNLYADQYFGAKRLQEINIFNQKKLTPETYGNCDLRMCFFTDVHTDADRLKSCVKTINFLTSNYVDVVMNGGDTTAVTDQESLAWYNDIIDTVNENIPVLNTVGNHDAWSSQNVIDPNPVNVYNLIIAPMVQRTTVIQPANAAQNGLNYYYKDFGIVRLITLDCMYWTEAQNTWLASVLSDANTNNKHVIIITHAAFPWDNMENVSCLWSTAGYQNYNAGMENDPTRTNIQAAQTVQNFINNNGNFICWITGHQHGDDVHKLPVYGNQFVVTMGSLAMRASTLLKNTDRYAYNYSCLTYICVDTTQKIIKFLRIGADIDIYGVKHNGLSINYGNNALIASW